MSPLPPEHDPGELATAANEVVRAIDGLRQEISSQKKYGRRNRSLIWLVAASVFLDFVISVVLVILFNRVNDAAEVAKASSSAQVVACRAGNETRIIQTDLWNTILGFPPALGETREEAADREKRVAEFRGYIDKAFALQDCEKLVKR